MPLVGSTLSVVEHSHYEAPEPIRVPVLAFCFDKRLTGHCELSWQEHAVPPRKGHAVLHASATTEAPSTTPENPRICFVGHLDLGRSFYSMLPLMSAAASDITDPVFTAAHIHLNRHETTAT